MSRLWRLLLVDNFDVLAMIMEAVSTEVSQHLAEGLNAEVGLPKGGQGHAGELLSLAKLKSQGQGAVLVVPAHPSLGRVGKAVSSLQ